MNEPLPTPSTRGRVPPGLQVATAYAWRIGVLVGAGLLVVLLLAELEVVVLPVVVAVLLAALLDPIASRARASPVPNWVGALGLLIATVAVIVGGVLLIVPAVIGQLGAVNLNVGKGIQQVESFVVHRLPVSQSEFNQAINQAFGGLQAAVGTIAGRLLGFATLAVQLLLQAVAALFMLFFFLKDGSRFWSWLRAVVPQGRRRTVEELLPQIWHTLRSYLLGVVIIGAIDALSIGLGLVLIGVPLVVPLIVLTFFGAFFPLVGAVVAGAVAALVALVSGGIVDALLVVGVTLLVQQLEGNVLQPLIMGRQVELHPVVTFLSVTAGGVLGGIPGAFLGVPIAAVTRVVLRYASPRMAAAGRPGPGPRAEELPEVPERVPP